MKTSIANSDAMIACIKAFLDPKVIDRDSEFATIIGNTRGELIDVLATWPVIDVPTKEQYWLARIAPLHLLGFPHYQFEYISTTYGISPEQIELLYFYWEGWKDGENPAQTREWKDPPKGLHLFGGFPSKAVVPYYKIPLLLRVDSDIVEFFKEDTHKQTYRRMHDVLRAHVESQED